MSLIKWDSLLDVENLFEETPLLESVGWDLAADVYEEGGDVIVEMQMPGIEADAYELSLEGSTLKVSGKREKETETADQEYFRKEIQKGSFERSIDLPEKDLKADEMRAVLQDGTLKIRIPKV